MSEMDQYARYFTAGTKVGVGIPLPNAEIFRDWAVIRELDEDLVSLQLSRDQLPARVSLHVGQILEIRGGKEEAGFSVRAIIVSESYAKVLLLRLIGEIVSDELREFYRIDAFLPIKYYLSQEQNPEILEKQWEARRQERLNDELLQKQKRWDAVMYQAGEAELPRERLQEQETGDSPDEAWDSIIPLAANVSGGGLRIVAHQSFESGEYVLLEILVPHPRHVVDAVARVAFATPNNAAGAEREYFNTGLKFVFIDERDRDAIVSHISGVQLLRIRQLREKYLFRSTDAPDAREAGSEPARPGWRHILKICIIWLIMLGFIWGVVHYFRRYTADRPKNEIEEVFEDGIKKYREIQRK